MSLIEASEPGDKLTVETVPVAVVTGAGVAPIKIPEVAEKAMVCAGIALLLLSLAVTIKVIREPGAELSELLEARISREFTAEGPVPPVLSTTTVTGFVAPTASVIVKVAVPTVKALITKIELELTTPVATRLSELLTM